MWNFIQQQRTALSRSRALSLSVSLSLTQLLCMPTADFLNVVQRIKGPVDPKKKTKPKGGKDDKKKKSKK